VRTKTAGTLAVFASCTFIGAAGAEDLGPQVKKLRRAFGNRRNRSLSGLLTFACLFQRYQQ
jgi:hypothetical protein